MVARAHSLPAHLAATQERYDDDASTSGCENESSVLLLPLLGRLDKRHRQREHIAFPWHSHRPASIQEDLDRLVSKYVKKPLQRHAARWPHQLAIPCWAWLKKYNFKRDLSWDLIAGASVAFMVVPQGMAYATLAGLPSAFGLYGALMPVFVYALFGSSRELAVGPVAVTSLLTSTALRELVPGSSEIINPNQPAPDQVAIQDMYNMKAVQLSFLVACMYTAVGVLRLGFLTNILSHPVVGGFSSGAAIIIGMSQLQHILGYEVPRADNFLQQVRNYADNIAGFKWQPYIFGTVLLTYLLVLKYYAKRHKALRWLRPLGPITACVAGLLAVWLGGLDAGASLKMVGRIPQGLPRLTVSSWFPMSQLNRMLPLALEVMLVDLLESTSIARQLAAKGHYELSSANQEIRAMGLANFAGSAFNAYTTTGSFSRSAVNFDSGCHSPLSGFFTACFVGLVLLFLTPVFERLPLCVMAAIVLSSVSGLLEYEQACHLFKVRKLDFLVWVTSCAGTLLLSVEMGLCISITLALLIVIYESAFPHTALLGRIASTTVYRNVKQYPDAHVMAGLVACRIDAPLLFFNVQWVRDKLRSYQARAAEYSSLQGIALQFVILDLTPVTHMDAMGAQLLEDLHRQLTEKQMVLLLCNPSKPVAQLMERSGTADVIGRGNVFVETHEAVSHCVSILAERGHAATAATWRNSSPTTSAPS